MESAEEDEIQVRGSAGMADPEAVKKLFKAVEMDDKMKIRHCLEVQHMDINRARNRVGEAVVHVLARKTSKLNQMKALHYKGADFGLRGGSSQMTPLHHVCENEVAYFEKEPTIRWLVNVAPDSLNAADDEGMTPFLLAAQSGPIKILRLLLELGADPTARTTEGHSAVFLCAQQGHLHSLYFLTVEIGLDALHKDVNGKTCLHWAAFHNHYQVCAFLRRLGLSALETDDEGCTPLHWGAMKGCQSVVPALVMGDGKKADAIVDGKGFRASMLAAKYSLRFRRVLGEEMERATKQEKGKKLTPNFKTAAGIICLLELHGVYALYYGSYLANMPIFTVVIVIGMLTIWYSLFMAAYSDPGVIAVDRDLSTAPLKLAPHELDRYTPSTDTFPICYTCNARRVLRSKHCVYENQCVARFDHYCPWVSNDVGLGNQIYFTIFLTSVTITTGMAAWLFYQHIFVLSPLLVDMATVKKSRIARILRRAPFMAAMGRSPWMLTMLFVDILVFLSVGGLFCTFWGWALSNLSTNEQINWRKYRHFTDRSTGHFTNPFSRGCWNNFLEYFALEQLPTGGVGRKVNWRTCNDMASYMEFREGEVTALRDQDPLNSVEKVV